jgi:CRISPR-associated endonuclease/helicase Cas3
MIDSYAQFFRRITDNEILPYQQRYSSDPFSPTLLVVPTGLGKSDAVLLPWLYAKACGDTAPTRLIIVLPRQNLTAQTAKNARKRCKAAGLENQIRVLELMAGSDDNNEILRPDGPAIIVATQDLYFSRALNRGYARRPPRWPIDFALYNQDCLVVLDEIQLMDDALATSTQMAAFRDRFGIFGCAPTVWMSATVNPVWLQTIDFLKHPREIGLEVDDLEKGIVKKRVHAPKSLALAPESCRTPSGCAAFAFERHQPGTRTLVMANTVPRAREIFAALRTKFPSTVLLHSRFRPFDRKDSAKLFSCPIEMEGQIVVSTQVLEAGVDITSRLLIADVAPWGSMVQRFGRVNRYGEDVSPEIWWVDKPEYSKQTDPTAPYSLEEVQCATERLANLSSASPAQLPKEVGPEPWQYVLRRADLLDLFDTSSDLSGNQLDVSRFIRATEDKDAYLAWREWEGDAEPPPSLDDLADMELCTVPIGELREFIKKHSVFTWSFANEEWSKVNSNQLFPGMLAVTRCTEGGYTAAEGWSQDSKAKVEPVQVREGPVDGDSSDKRSFPKFRQTLREHTDRVVEEIKVLIETTNLAPEYAAALLTAATLHDWGKAHEVFQATLHINDNSPDLLAKQIGNAKHSRKHFRHELASALAMLQTGESDLASYLVAAHHGKIRLGIRSMPSETEIEGVRTARGVREGDRLPACEVATQVFRPSVDLSLKQMEFGAKGGSWTDRMLHLRDELGPFRLAYLETLLRSADETASDHPYLEETACPK